MRDVALGRLDPRRRVDRLARARHEDDGHGGSQRLPSHEARRPPRGTTTRRPRPAASTGTRDGRRPRPGSRRGRSPGRAAGCRAPRAPVTSSFRVCCAANQSLPATPPPSVATASLIRRLAAIIACRAVAQPREPLPQIGQLGVRLLGAEAALLARHLGHLQDRGELRPSTRCGRPARRTPRGGRGGRSARGTCRAPRPVRRRSPGCRPRRRRLRPPSRRARAPGGRSRGRASPCPRCPRSRARRRTSVSSSLSSRSSSQGSKFETIPSCTPSSRRRASAGRTSANDA